MDKFETRAVRYMTDLIRDFKFEPFQAAGFPGNFGVETGGFEHVQELDPVGGGRGGLGDAQWTGPRRRDFEAWLARNADKGWDARTYEANYSMLYRDLVGPERATVPALLAAATVDQAAEIVMLKYERPGVPHLDRRKAYARQALAAFNTEVSAGRINLQNLRTDGRSTDTAEQEILLPVPQPHPQAPQNALERLLPILMQVVQLLLSQKNAPASPTTIKVDVPTAEPSPLTRPSVQIGALGLAVSTALQSFHILGAPAGADSTVAGTVATLAPAILAGLGVTGVWGKVAQVGVSLIASRINVAQQQKQK